MTELAGVATKTRESEASQAGETRPVLALVLWGGTALTVVGAGLLLWSTQGEAVFMDMVTSALAMCF